MTQREHATLSASVLSHLHRILGRERVLTAPEHLAAYAYDATPGRGSPAAVALPRSVEEVAGVLRLANAERVPVVPRGAGTNLSGGAIPPPGSIVIATQRMARVLEIEEGNLTATAQPGIVLHDFQQAVEAKGLFYPPDPSSYKVATLGGTVAESAGGLRGVKYGTTKDYIIGLEVALASGEVVRTGGKTVKNVAGYDLTHLFVGSEGTLGVITEITTRLLPLPEARRTILAVFDSLESSAEAVAAIIACKIVPRSLEMIDGSSLAAIEQFKPTGLPLDAEAVLLIDVDGRVREADEDAAQVMATCRAAGSREARLARSEEESERLWTARRSHYPALARVRPNIIIEDVTVPRDDLPRMVRAVKEASARHRVQIGLVAHAGEGNLHPDILCDTRDAEEMKRVHAFLEDIVRVALELGGTLTGEHGVGTIKAPYLAWQLGREGIEVMRRIKDALDPNNILNPDKLFSPDVPPRPSRACH